jgi:hypothetical protein
MEMADADLVDLCHESFRELNIFSAVDTGDEDLCQAFVHPNIFNKYVHLA